LSLAVESQYKAVIFGEGSNLCFPIALAYRPEPDHLLFVNRAITRRPKFGQNEFRKCLHRSQLSYKARLFVKTNDYLDLWLIATAQGKKATSDL
jgi:hypothetical protein